MIHEPILLLGEPDIFSSTIPGVFLDIVSKAFAGTEDLLQSTVLCADTAKSEVSLFLRYFLHLLRRLLDITVPSQVCSSLYRVYALELFGSDKPNYAHDNQRNSATSVVNTK
jgi:hypothetical protein